MRNSFHFLKVQKKPRFSFKFLLPVRLKINSCDATIQFKRLPKFKICTSKCFCSIYLVLQSKPTHVNAGLGIPLLEVKRIAYKVDLMGK